MPFGMDSYVQSVVIQGKLYVGGGYAGSGSYKKYIIMVYDINTKMWTTLPPYRLSHFAMAVINQQLVLVGGGDNVGDYSKVLGVWVADRKVWIHPYPEMPTARYNCSVAVSNKWLVVAGGWVGRHLSRVEVLNTDSKQWHVGPQTPMPWSRMKTAMVGDTVYFTGGYIGLQASTAAYCLSFHALISNITSEASSDKTQRDVWKQVAGSQMTVSSPLSINGSLLAVGGKKDGKAVTAINLYQPDTDMWVKVGDLPSPRCQCTCAMTRGKEVIVAGGEDKREGLLKKIDFGLL